MARAVRWRFVGRRTKEERRQQRKHVVLKDAGITEKTQLRYYIAVGKLLPHLESVKTTLQMDEAICQWIQERWEDGESLHIVSDALCGLHHYEPWTKRTIPQSWRLFSTWRKLEGPDRAPPLTSQIIYSWCNYAIEHKQLYFSSLLALGFFALLRTGELMQVCACDILIGQDNGIVSLRDTKTGKRDNAAEMVMFDDPLTVDLLSTVVALQKDLGLTQVPIWPHSAQKFRDVFAHYTRRFDLAQHQFRPYSLRRGGATALFQATGSMEAALLKGRWSSPRVAKIYISDALSYLPGLTFSNKAKEMLRRWSPSSTH